jgi:hypothetical protein
MMRPPRPGVSTASFPPSEQSHNGRPLKRALPGSPAACIHLTHIPNLHPLSFVVRH